MAFTTEALSQLELSDEQAKEVMKLHGQDLNSVKAQLNDVTAERDGLKSQVEESPKQLKSAQKSAEEGSDLAKQLADLQEASKQAQKKYESDLQATKLGYEIDNAITASGALNSKATKALIDLDKVSFGDDGKLIGLNDQLESVKENNGFLFKQESEPEQPKPGQKVVVDGNPSAGTPEPRDVSKMSYLERLQFKNSDPEGYEQATQHK